MNPKIKKLQRLSDYDEGAEILTSLANEGGAAVEGLADVLPKLLPIAHLELRGAVLFAYCHCFPAQAIGVLQEQVGRVTNPEMLETIAGLVLDHAEALKESAGSEALASALLAKCEELDDDALCGRYTEAAAALAPAEQAVEVLAEAAKGPGPKGNAAILKLCELGRADLAVGCLDRLARALESNDQMERGVALEILAAMGAVARPILPSLHQLAQRLGPDVYGLKKALEAVQGSAEVPAGKPSFDLQRVKALAAGTPSWDAWGELMRLLHAAPEGLDPKPVVAELEPLLAKWPADVRGVAKDADLASADRWGALVRSVVVARRGWTAADVEKFVAAAAFPNLVSLKLDDNRIGDQGIEHLLEAAWFGRLESLAVVSDKLTDAAAKLLAKAPLSALKKLDLRYNQITAKGARSLSESKTLHLAKLELGLEAAEDDPV